jgi:hypothetical protein
MIRSFDPPRGLKVRVLFDAFYLSPTVTKACQARGFTWFSVASRNRTLTRTWGVGQKIGDHVLDPGLTEYTKRALYVTYDVTEQVQAGIKLVEKELGSIEYSSITPPRALCAPLPWSGRKSRTGPETSAST